jgi:hypothetical protein
MTATTAFGTDLLDLIFTAVNFANLADNAVSAPVTEFYISLHTASPGTSGTQSTSETAYTGYARQSVARTTGGWTVASATATNDAEISFGQCSASPGSDITHVGIGLSSSGTGTLYLYGELDNSIIMQVGATPQFAISALEVVAS